MICCRITVIYLAVLWAGYAQDCTTSDYLNRTRRITLSREDGADPDPGCVKPNDNLAWGTGIGVKKLEVVFQDKTPLASGETKITAYDYQDPPKAYAVAPDASGPYTYKYSLDGGTAATATILVGVYQTRAPAIAARRQSPGTIADCPGKKNKNSQLVQFGIVDKKLVVDVEHTCLNSGGSVKWSISDPQISSFTVTFKNAAACATGCKKIVWNSDSPPAWSQVYYCNGNPKCMGTSRPYKVVITDKNGKTYSTDPDIIIDAAQTTILK